MDYVPEKFAIEMELIEVDKETNALLAWLTFLVLPSSLSRRHVLHRSMLDGVLGTQGGTEILYLSFC